MSHLEQSDNLLQSLLSILKSDPQRTTLGLWMDTQIQSHLRQLGSNIPPNIQQYEEIEQAMQESERQSKTLVQSMFQELLKF